MTDENKEFLKKEISTTKKLLDFLETSLESGENEEEVSRMRELAMLIQSDQEAWNEDSKKINEYLEKYFDEENENDK